MHAKNFGANCHSVHVSLKNKVQPSVTLHVSPIANPPPHPTPPHPTPPHHTTPHHTPPHPTPHKIGPVLMPIPRAEQSIPARGAPEKLPDSVTAESCSRDFMNNVGASNTRTTFSCGEDTTGPGAPNPRGRHSTGPVPQGVPRHLLPDRRTPHLRRGGGGAGMWRLFGGNSQPCHRVLPALNGPPTGLYPPEIASPQGGGGGGGCSNSRPRYRKQMREHDSAQAGKESGYTTNAKKEEIFSDMS